jgi:hypothetical protein
VKATVEAKAKTAIESSTIVIFGFKDKEGKEEINKNLFVIFAQKC